MLPSPQVSIELVGLACGTPLRDVVVEIVHNCTIQTRSMATIHVLLVNLLTQDRTEVVQIGQVVDVFDIITQVDKILQHTFLCLREL